jgi:phospholipid/cholesterol/gamma-HCH transport system substrate-binding protein
MISRRVLANLALFGLIGLILAVWAATNVLNLSALTHPYDITAQFSSSPGLRSHFEVAYLGVKVGSVSSVDLGPGMAVVRLSIDNGEKLPVGLRAEASRQSPVGEPYVALSPPPGYAGNGPYLQRGYVIPVKDTSAPLSYEDVFNALDRLVQAVPPDAVHTLVHELALGLAGRADDLRALIENTDSLTTTLAANADQVNQLVSDLSQIAQTLADHGGALGASFDNLAAISSALAQSKQSIDSILATAPDFAHQVADVLGASDANLGCLLNGLGLVSTALSTAQAEAALAEILDDAPQELTVIPALKATTATGGSLKGAPRIAVGNPPVPVYPATKQLPPVPVVPVCAQGASPSATALGATGGAGGSATPTAGPHGVPAVAPGQSALLPAQSSTQAVHARKFPFWILVVVAALALIVVVGLLGRRIAVQK